MAMVKSRNQTSHTYNQEVAEHIAKLIIESYHPLFVAFKERMQHVDVCLAEQSVADHDRLA